MNLFRARLWSDSGAAGTASDPATTREPQETPEQKAERLEKELKDRDDQLKAEAEKVKQERQLRLQNEQKARDAQQALEAQRSQISPATGDPLDQLHARLKQQQAQLAADRLTDPTVDLALLEVEGKLAAREHQLHTRRMYEQWDAEFAALRSDPEKSPHCDKALAAFKQGRAASPTAAVDLVMGEAKREKELADLQKEKEELKRDLAAAREPRVSEGYSVPVLSVDKPPDPGKKIRVKRSDWANLDKQPAHVQRQWNAAFSAAMLEFVD